MRNVFKKIFGFIAAASFAGIFGFYFKQADIGYSTVCIGMFLTSLCIASVLSAKPAGTKELMFRKKARASREVRLGNLQLLPDCAIILGILLGPSTIVYGAATVLIDAVTQPGSALTAYVANTMFSGATNAIDCAKSFLLGISYAFLVLQVIVVIASLAIYLYTHWYRIKAAYKTKFGREKVAAHE